MSKTLNPDMIVLAREYRNITQKQLARSVFVSQAKIAKIEGGVAGNVPDEFIYRIAKSLSFELDFFFQDEERLGFGSSSYFYRKRAQISAADRKYISGVVNLIRINLKKFLHAVEIEAKRKLPFFEIEDYNSIPDIAMALRNYWNIPEGPIKNLTALIESAGVLIIPCDFGSKAMDATSFRYTSMPPMIFINKHIPGDRWRFTLAHELAHLVMHDVPCDTMEKEADSFAAELLIPESDISAQLKLFHKIRILDLANIKPYWKVSIAALLFRAGELGFINENQRRNLWSQMSKFGYRKKEPNEIEVEKVYSYPMLFRYFRENLNYSINEMARSVAIPRQDFLSLHASALSPADSLRVVN